MVTDRLFIKNLKNAYLLIGKQKQQSTKLVHCYIFFLMLSKKLFKRWIHQSWKNAMKISRISYGLLILLLPWYFSAPENAIPTPIMMGGLFAIDRNFFFASGANISLELLPETHILIETVLIEDPLHI